MRIRCISISLSMVMVFLSGMAFAHGTEKHGAMVPVDARMKKLHAMMPMFSVASAKLETALEHGDAVAAEAEAGKITAAIPDLKKSKPHKNIKQRKNFVEHASNLEETMNPTIDLVKKGDFAGAKTSFKKVEKVCAACHATFRD